MRQLTTTQMTVYPFPEFRPKKERFYLAYRVYPEDCLIDGEWEIISWTGVNWCCWDYHNDRQEFPQVKYWAELPEIEED